MTIIQSQNYVDDLSFGFCSTSRTPWLSTGRHPECMYIRTTTHLQCDWNRSICFTEYLQESKEPKEEETIATQILTAHTSNCYSARLVIWFLNLGYFSSCHSVKFVYMYLRWTWKENCVALNFIAVYLLSVASTCLSKEHHTNLNFYEFPQLSLCITEQCPRCWYKTSSTTMSWPPPPQSFLYTDKS